MSADQSPIDGGTDNTVIPRPPEKPTQVADLDPHIHAQGNIQQSAHIPVRGGTDPEPLCVHGIDYTKDVTWVLKAQAVYPDPNAWFTLCEKCLQEYEQATTGGERA